MNTKIKKILTSGLLISSLFCAGTLGLTSCSPKGLTSSSPKSIYVKRTKNARTATRTVKSIKSAKPIDEDNSDEKEETSSSYTVDVEDISSTTPSRNKTYDITIYTGEIIKDEYGWGKMTEKTLSKDLFGIGLKLSAGGFADNRYAAETAVLYASTSESESTTEVTSLHTLVTYGSDERIDPTKLNEEQEVLIKTVVLEETRDDGGYEESSNYKTAYTDIKLTIKDTIAPVCNFTENSILDINQIDLINNYGGVKFSETLKEMMKEKIASHIFDDTEVSVEVSIPDEAISYIDASNYDKIVSVYENKIPFTFSVKDTNGNSDGLEYAAFVIIGVHNDCNKLYYPNAGPGPSSLKRDLLRRMSVPAGTHVTLPSDIKLLSDYINDYNELITPGTKEYKDIVENEQSLEITYEYNGIKLNCSNSDDGKFKTILAYNPNFKLNPNYKYTSLEDGSENEYKRYIYDISTLLETFNKLDIYDADELETREELNIGVLFIYRSFGESSLIDMYIVIYASDWHYTFADTWCDYINYRFIVSTMDFPLMKEIDGCIVKSDDYYTTNTRFKEALSSIEKMLKIEYNPLTSSWDTYSIVDNVIVYR